MIKYQLEIQQRPKVPNIGSDFLQRRSIKSNELEKFSKAGDFIKSTETKTLTGEAGATILPLVGNLFMYRRTSKTNSRSGKVFVQFGRTDFLQNRY